MKSTLLTMSLLLGCHDKVPPAATGPVPALACDYTNKLPKTHMCTEVRDAAIVDSQRAWWAKLPGKDHSFTCTANARCPVEGRTGGCLYPNGNIEWRYDEPAAEVQRVCTTGKFVSISDTPAPLTFETYRCANSAVCHETRSAIDMLPTVTATNCATGGSKFEKGSCPTENVVGHCRTSSSQEENLWSFYAPRTADDARAACTDLEGTFVDK